MGKNRWRGVSPEGHRRRTEERLILGGFLLILLVGGALAWLLMGRSVAILAVGVIALAGGVLMLLYELLGMVEAWLKRE